MTTPTVDNAQPTLHDRTEAILKGGAPKYHESAKAAGKLFARDRIALLVDAGSFKEDGLFANNMAKDLPADGVVTGIATVDGRPVAIMANDSTVKAGSWGARTVEKIIRIQETATKLNIPLFYLVDSAGARITDQVEMFPGRRGAGKIFFNQVRLSGVIPQVCILFGPSAAGGAYIPAFCDVVIMVEGNASMYLGSPRMAEMVIGEKVTLDEMGGARMHCTTSGVGDVLAKTEEEAIELAKKYIAFFPQNSQDMPPEAEARDVVPGGKAISQVVPPNENMPFDMMNVITQLVDENTFFPMKKLFAQEMITGFARINGRAVGILANQPKVKGGVLFVDSADKAARFIWLCDAYSIPLLFLADVPGFMIGSKVEKEGIIRHGAKMISAMADATVPKISVVVRKAYGAGLYAMSGPAFEPECTLALPSASIAVMGPEAAINAVYANKIAELEGDAKTAFIEEKRAEYRKDIDLYRLASELVIDAIIEPDQLRDELITRFAMYETKEPVLPTRKHGVFPV
ncbi:Methylmalonyl-CoA carboxyltransferase 12S subunit [compost metagenome]